MTALPRTSGWFVPFGAAVALILPEPLGAALEEATVQLFRIGVRPARRRAGGRPGRVGGRGDRPARRVPDDVEALHAQGLAGADGYALDVRDQHEWREDGVVPGTSESRSASCRTGWPPSHATLP